jgi:NADPH-dependent 7-cyano-7-deazaguanine reductase QueF
MTAPIEEVMLQPEEALAKPTSVVEQPGIRVLQEIDSAYGMLVTLTNIPMVHTCPTRGCVDMSMLTIVYRPKTRIIEKNSLLMYVKSFERRSISTEAAVSEIMGMIRYVADPKFLEIDAQQVDWWNQINVTITWEGEEK